MECSVKRVLESLDHNLFQRIGDQIFFQYTHHKCQMEKIHHFSETNLYRVKTTVPIKRVGCSVLKSLIEEDKIVIEDENIIQELTSFISKRNTYEADDGHNDDLVMTLVLFSWASRQGYFKELTGTDIRKGIYQKKIEEMENSYVPFGFVSDGLIHTESEWDGKDRWFGEELR